MIKPDELQEQASAYFGADAINAFQAAQEIGEAQTEEADQEQLLMVVAKCFYVAGVERAAQIIEESEAKPGIILCSNLQ